MAPHISSHRAPCLCFPKKVSLQLSSEQSVGDYAAGLEDSSTGEVPRLQKFCRHNCWVLAACAGSILFSRRCDTLCTSGFSGWRHCLLKTGQAEAGRVQKATHQEHQGSQTLVWDLINMQNILHHVSDRSFHLTGKRRKKTKNFPAFCL